VNLVDPTGYFSEEQIKQFFGFSLDDPWEEVLKLFEEGGMYEGRWGWLEILRQAEIGDDISIEWIEGAFPDGHTIPGTLTFGLDPNGNLILIGDGYYIDAEAAGLFGDEYSLTHYTDLSGGFCSPYECRYSTNFSTSAIHDPYLHRQIEWEEFFNPIAVADLAKMVGGTVFTGGLTMGSIGIVGATCTTPFSCIAGVALMGPNVTLEAVATYYLALGTYQVFLSEFTEVTP
jgi:hypothetical protein